jgi:hypothetical protein
MAASILTLESAVRATFNSWASSAGNVTAALHSQGRNALAGPLGSGGSGADARNGREIRSASISGRHSGTGEHMTGHSGRCVGTLILAVALAATLAVPAHAAKSAPPGPIKISVDATHDLASGFSTRSLSFPVQPGPLTLYYPKWMPADHSPDGPVWNLMGLKFSSGGKEIPWHQDLWTCMHSTWTSPKE